MEVITLMIVSLKDFRLKMTKIMKKREKVIITKRGKPVYILEPSDPADEFLMWIEQAHDEIKSSGITDEEVQNTFESAKRAADEKIRRS